MSYNCGFFLARGRMRTQYSTVCRRPSRPRASHWSDPADVATQSATIQQRGQLTKCARVSFKRILTVHTLSRAAACREPVCRRGWPGVPCSVRAAVAGQVRTLLPPGCYNLVFCAAYANIFPPFHPQPHRPPDTPPCLLLGSCCLSRPLQAPHTSPPPGRRPRRQRRGALGALPARAGGAHSCHGA